MVAGQAIDPAEAMLDGRHRQVSHVVTGDAACGGEEAHGFPVTAVECELSRHCKRQPFRSKPPSHRCKQAARTPTRGRRCKHGTELLSPALRW